MTTSLSTTTVTAQAPPHPLRWWTLVVLCLSVGMITIDDTIVNVALPSLSQAFAATASQLQWIVESYIVVLASLVLTTGSLSDRIGRRRSLLWGLLIFGTTSALGAISGSANQLIAVRAAMGVGAALIMPSTLSIIRTVFPSHERQYAIGVWGGVTSLSLIAGPLLGGWLLEHFWWGSVFLINVPLSVIAVVGALRLVPEIRANSATPIDWLGTLLSAGGICALVFGIIEASADGWLHPVTLIPLLGGLLLLGAFIMWQRRTRHPLIDLHLFRNPRFSAASVSVALAYSALVGVMFVVTQHLQFVLNYSPLQAGVRLLPLLISVAVAGPLGGALTARWGTRTIVIGGLLSTAAGLVLLATSTQGGSYALLSLAFVLIGAGIGTAAIAAADSIMGAAPAAKAGAAAAVDEVAIQLGSALGIAVLGSVLSWSYARGLLAVDQIASAVRDRAADGIGVAVRVADEIGGAAGSQLLLAARSAFTDALGTTALLGAAQVALGALIAFVFLPRRSSQLTHDA